MIHAALRELRALAVFVAQITAVFLLVFLAGALVGTFLAGCKAIAGLAPGV